MGTIPSSMVAAVACSAAAGKNPWLPLALVFLLAAPDSVPAMLIDPALQQGLHDLGPTPVLWTLGGVFLVLALADSLADKIGLIERWLVPISTAWRPFAGIAVAGLIGVSALGDAGAAEVGVEAMRSALTSTAHADVLVGGSVLALTIGAAALGTWIATMSKTGIRLLMTLVPVPGLKLAHSFLDDLFAIVASVVGLAFAHSLPVVVLLALYLVVGLVTAPMLTRLTWIHVRIGWNLLMKGAQKLDESTPIAKSPPPAWVVRWQEENGASDAVLIPSYVYRAPGLGFCRAGHLILGSGRVVFLTRVWWRPRAYVIDERSLARIGLAETATSRVVALVERMESGALREVNVVLFPAVQDEVLRSLLHGAWRAGLVRVRSDSESARRGLPGFADRGRSTRFLPAEEAGSLRLQGLITIASAIGIGILTGGVFVPIGTGYLISPFKRRFVLAWLVSGYLSLCVVASILPTFGVGWVLAVLYASLLNVLALRDLTRNAIKARVDGYVDRRAWLPAVSARVWVPATQVLHDGDRHREGEPELLTDGTWRAVGKLLAGEEERAEPVSAAAT